MKISRIIPALTLAAILLTGCGQRSDQPKWFKGNLHTHSFWSDGDGYPEMIMDWYKTNGYNFIGLSDHNILAEGEKWILVPKSKMHAQAFEKYLARFGDDWVEQRIDTGRTHVRLKTYVQYKELFEDENFLIIQSEELTDRFGNKPIHVNATNIRERIAPQGGASVADVMQRNVDAVLKQRKETGVPMFPHINHPNFGFAVDVEDMISLRGDRFFEVFNGHPLVHNYGDSLHPAIEDMWDRINLAYRKRGQPLMLGLASDDSHNYHQFGPAYANAGRGWVMVKAGSLTPDALIAAMEAGDFYASTGVVLNRCDFIDGEISIEVTKEEGVNYQIYFIGAMAGDSSTRVLETVRGTSARFEVNPEYDFVRAKIFSTKLKANPFRDKDVEVAWTQPVFVN